MRPDVDGFYNVFCNFSRKMTSVFEGFPKGSPKDPRVADRDPKGTPRDAKRKKRMPSRQPKGVQGCPKGSPEVLQREPKGLYMHELPINRPSGRYVIK